MKKIQTLEKEVEKAADLHEQINILNAAIEECDVEKTELQSSLENAEKKCKFLECQLDKVAKEKDSEIVSLQKGKYFLLFNKSNYCYL